MLQTFYLLPGEKNQKIKFKILKSCFKHLIILLSQTEEELFQSWNRNSNIQKNWNLSRMWNWVFLVTQYNLKSLFFNEVVLWDYFNLFDQNFRMKMNFLSEEIGARIIFIHTRLWNIFFNIEIYHQILHKFTKKVC